MTDIPNAPNEEVIDVDREIEVKDSQTLEDGKHAGVITKLTYKDAPYQYVDLWIKPDNKDIEIKVGYPQNITVTSALGELLRRFEVDLVSGSKINLYNTLVGKKVEFLTITEPVKTANGTREYSRIVRESLKPLKELQ